MDAEVDTSFTPPTRPLQRAMELLDTIPGVDHITAWTLVAEMGANMDQFGSASRLAKWAGICPGNNDRKQTSLREDAQRRHLVAASAL